MMLYLRNIIKNYPIIKTFKYAVLFAASFLLIDIFNWPSEFLFSHDVKLNRIAGVVIVTLFLMFILLVSELKLIETVRISSINFIDEFSMTIVITCLIYSGISLIYSQLYLYKLITIAFILIFYVVLMIYRGNKIKWSLINSENYESNIIDLKKIFDGDFVIKKDEMIMIQEKDVDYDLFERGRLINQLFSVIEKCKPDGRFVISLEGKWGSGKTTIINNVIKKLKESDANIVIINNFDPWSYYDQKSLFINMFDTILKKSGFKYSPISTNQIVESVSQSIFGSKKIGTIFEIIFKQNNKTEDLKNKINDYLRTSGKKVVFFIDNIDRTESENIILLFKLVGNILDFERVTYILSFDDERIKKIFNNINQDYEYLKKIVQLQIRMPAIDKNVQITVFKKCLHNLLMGYGESESDFMYCNSIIDFIIKGTNDIRDFKIYINSVIELLYSGKSNLNKRDVLLIEYIRLFNLALYLKIHQNRKFFISHDKIVDEEIISISFNHESFNSRAKDFFKELFENKDNCKYKEVLGEIFPYVKKYNSGVDLESNVNIASNEEYKDIAKNRRICSAKYFDLYFTNTENNFIYIGLSVSNFVENVNKILDLNDRESEYQTLIKSIHPTYQRELFERLELYIEDLNENATFDMVKILFKNIREVDYSYASFALNAQSRVEVIVWELLKIIPENNFDAFLESIEKEYSKMKIIRDILYWFENDRDQENNSRRKLKWDNINKKMGNTILENGINIYDDEYYFPKNIWGLYHLYKEDLVRLQKYIKTVVKEDNIFRFLHDIMSPSYGTEIKYAITEENLQLFITKNDIDQILRNIEPSSKDQQFVLDVYKSLLNDTKDHWGKTGITVDKERNIIL